MNQTSCSLGDAIRRSVVPFVITTVATPLRHDSRLLSTMWWLPENVCMLTAMRCVETRRTKGEARMIRAKACRNLFVQRGIGLYMMLTARSYSDQQTTGK